jgi:plastocyanin
MTAHRHRSPRILSALGILFVSLLTHGYANAGETPATVVVAKEFMFSPATLTVAAGTTVTWSNFDEEPHTVVSDSGLFRSPALDTNQSFSFKFDAPGTYRFVCSIHPQMIGTIIVR